MSRLHTAATLVLLIALLAVAAYSSRGGYLHAVVTGQCSACPAPPVCTSSESGGRFRAAQPPAIDGCKPAWWKRFG